MSGQRKLADVYDACNDCKKGAGGVMTGFSSDRSDHMLQKFRSYCLFTSGVLYVILGRRNFQQGG